MISKAAQTATAAASTMVETAADDQTSRSCVFYVQVVKDSPIHAYCMEFSYIIKNPIFSELAAEVSDLEAALESNVAAALLAGKDLDANTADKAGSAPAVSPLPPDQRTELWQTEFVKVDMIAAATARRFVQIVQKSVQKLVRYKCQPGSAFVVRSRFGSHGDLIVNNVLQPTYVELAAALIGALSFMPYGSSGLSVADVPVLVPLEHGAWQLLACAVNNVFEGQRPAGACFVLDADIKSLGILKSAYVVSLEYLQTAVYYFVARVSDHVFWMKYCRSSLHPTAAKIDSTKKE